MFTFVHFLSSRYRFETPFGFWQDAAICGRRLIYWAMSRKTDSRGTQQKANSKDCGECLGCTGINCHHCHGIIQEVCRIMHHVKFPVNIQMDGRLYTVVNIICPKQVGEPWAVAYSHSFLGKREVQSPSTRIRLAKRVLERNRV